MKTIKFIISAFIILSIAGAVYADSVDVKATEIVDTLIDSTSVVTDHVSEEIATEEAGTSFDWNKVMILIVGLYELFVRLYPTEKNYSILSILHKILNFFIPNKKKQGGTH